MTVTQTITNEITYWPRALVLWAKASEETFANIGYTKAQALSMILRRQFRIHWMRG